MLERVLIIDGAPEVEHIIRFCAHSVFPDIIVETYDPACGLPERSFNWGRYDLLLLEYELGRDDQNGLHWLRLLKRRPNTPPIIMLTSRDSKQLEARAHRTGADDCLNKNHLTPELFAQRVKKALISRRGRTEDEYEDDDLAERTRLLSPQEKRHAMRLAGAASRRVDHHERTALMSRAEMAAIASGRAPASSAQATPERVTPEQIDPQRSTPQIDDKEPADITASKRWPGRGTGAAAGISITVPGYYLEEKIGEGGMASIYLAEREEDQLKVVLKVLSLDKSLSKQNNSGLLRRFMREYRMIGQIDHPNVVKIHERAFASDFAYIAMEYFSHGDLAERLKTGVDGKTAIAYLHQIAEGLGAAHALGIVHRDMKPANILFRSADELAITDFGIAKDVEAENQNRDGLTMHGQLMGTLYYISPEQIQGADADQRSDIYSLGIIMYKMLTNKHPYAGGNPMRVFEQHLSSPIPKLPKRFAPLQPLLDGLLCKDPDERFQSTEDLLMGLNWKEWA